MNAVETGFLAGFSTDVKNTERDINM